MKVFLIAMIILLAGTAHALRVRNDYGEKSAVMAEFINMDLSKQDRAMSVTESTPAYQNMVEFAPVIFSSGAKKWLIRIGTEIYKIELQRN